MKLMLFLAVLSAAFSTSVLAGNDSIVYQYQVDLSPSLNLDKRCTFNFTKESNLEHLPTKWKKLLLKGLDELGYTYAPEGDNNYQISLKFEKKRIDNSILKKNILTIKLFSNYRDKVLPELNNFEDRNGLPFNIFGSDYQIFKHGLMSDFTLTVDSVLEQFKSCNVVSKYIDSFFKSYSDFEVVFRKKSLVDEGYISNAGKAILMCWHINHPRVAETTDVIEFGDRDESLAFKVKWIRASWGRCLLKVHSKDKIPFKVAYFDFKSFNKTFWNPRNDFNCIANVNTFTCENKGEEIMSVRQTLPIIPVDMY